jgi:hypothetical protein
MTDLPSPATARSRSSGWRPLWIVLSALGVLLVIAANVHLVYVAIRSQPACVDHVKSLDVSNEMFRAAKPSC